MPTELLVASIFIILLGYFTNPFRFKMYLLSFLGLEARFIIKLITSTNSQIQEIATTVNEPVWKWIIAAIYFVALFVFGRWLASMDNKTS